MKEHLFSCKVCGTQLGLRYEGDFGALTPVVESVGSKLAADPNVYYHCDMHCSVDSDEYEDHVDCDGWMSPIKGAAGENEKKMVSWILMTKCPSCNTVHGVMVVKSPYGLFMDNVIAKGLELFMNDKRVKGLCVGCGSWYSVADNLKVIKRNK